MSRRDSTPATSAADSALSRGAVASVRRRLLLLTRPLLMPTARAVAGKCLTGVRSPPNAAEQTEHVSIRFDGWIARRRVPRLHLGPRAIQVGRILEHDLVLRTVVALLDDAGRKDRMSRRSVFQARQYAIVASAKPEPREPGIGRSGAIFEFDCSILNGI